MKGQQMDAARRLRLMAMVLLAALLVLAVLLSLALGAVTIPLGDTVLVLVSLILPMEHAVEAQLIVEQIRLPRTLMGMLVGATLALTGAAMQGLFRNPLADPGLIGVSSGAALGVALILVLGGPWLAMMPDALLPYATVLGAFIGGALTTWLVYRLGQSVHGTSVANMLLAGIAIAAVSGAFIGLLSYLADDAMLRTLVFWNMGSLGGASFERVGMLALCCALVWWRLPRQAKALNALLLGESEARHLGIEVERVKRELVLLTALGVGACVAAAGLIGFVGLVVPHLVRLMVGANHRYVLPASMLLGAGLLLVADVAARLVVAPAELPLGILTALLGAPFFLALLLRAQRNGGV
ncbi:FecCD family ABC transporter permease [Pseudomonas sp. OIL-1]|uniref:FecCD family ABC transporter permease n=1 Tax=Pseudomonas sp. OIL-1 TaxID=2706126 RepID=UPI003531F9C4